MSSVFSAAASPRANDCAIKIRNRLRTIPARLSRGAARSGHAVRGAIRLKPASAAASPGSIGPDRPFTVERYAALARQKQDQASEDERAAYRISPVARRAPTGTARVRAKPSRTRINARPQHETEDDRRKGDADQPGRAEHHALDEHHPPGEEGRAGNDAPNVGYSAGREQRCHGERGGDEAGKRQIRSVRRSATAMMRATA